MDKWLGYLIEAGILGFFALMYYLFQRKRIIRVDIHEIFVLADEVYVDLEKLKESKKLDLSYHLKIKELAECLESEDFDKLKLLINEFNQSINSEIDIKINKIKERINFYK